VAIAQNPNGIAVELKGAIVSIDTTGSRCNIVMAIRDKEFTGLTETVALPSLP
jgi:hypothetical protein